MRRRLEATRWADDFGKEDWAYGVERVWLEGMTGFPRRMNGFVTVRETPGLAQAVVA